MPTGRSSYRNAGNANRSTGGTRDYMDKGKQGTAAVRQRKLKWSFNNSDEKRYKIETEQPALAQIYVKGSQNKLHTHLIHSA